MRICRVLSPVGSSEGHPACLCTLGVIYGAYSFHSTSEKDARKGLEKDAQKDIVNDPNGVGHEP